MIDLYRSAWAVCQHVRTRRLGHDLTEAAACGTPAVATRIPGHVDAIDEGVSGLLADDEAGFVANLSRIANDPALWPGSGPARSSTPPSSTGPRPRPASCRPWLRRPKRHRAHSFPRAGSKGLTRALRRRLREAVPTFLLGAVIYIPLLFTKPGKISADTKSYLYLDPGRMLGRAVSMWDPNIGMGTVTHQNIGYLWPIGPYYWLAQALGLPDWVAQRLWLGSILFLAGVGVRYLLYTLGQRGPHVTAATFVYALTPYVLTLAARISIILLPYAGLPWLIAFTVLALRRGGWRYPALFALTVATIGSVNATALLLCRHRADPLDPERDVRDPRGGSQTRRGGRRPDRRPDGRLLALVDRRPLGPGRVRHQCPPVHRDRRDGWFGVRGARGAAWPRLLVLLRRGPLRALDRGVEGVHATGMAAGGHLPAADPRAGRCARSPGSAQRAFFASLIFVGMVLAIGGHPWADPPIVGRGIKAFLRSDAGLAMRSLPRAAPLLVLGLSVFLGSGIAALTAERQRWARPAVAVVMILALLGLTPLWTGQMVDKNLDRDEAIPDYWKQDAAYLDRARRRHPRPRGARNRFRVLSVGLDGRPDHTRA